MAPGSKLVMLTLVAFGCMVAAWLYAARHRVTTTPRVHLIPDMDNQQRANVQAAFSTAVFGDGRAARAPVPGAVARGELRYDDHFFRGLVNGQPAATFPVIDDAGKPLVIDTDFIRRGHKQFDIRCSPCHGLSGDGGGLVFLVASQRPDSKMVPPANLHDERLVKETHGYLFDVISNGKNTMEPVGKALSERDRWAVVAYVRALQTSRNADASLLSEAQRAKLPAGQ